MRSSVYSSRRDYSPALGAAAVRAPWWRRAHGPLVIAFAAAGGCVAALLTHQHGADAAPGATKVLPPQTAVAAEAAPSRGLSTASLNPIASAEASALHSFPADPQTLNIDESLGTAVEDGLVPSEQWLEMTVAKGDTLSGLFDRYDLAAADWMALARLDDAGKQLQRMRPGDVLRVSVNDARRVNKLSYAVDELRTLSIERGADDAFLASELVADVETRVAYATGTITSSLFLAAAEAGMSDRTTMGLAAIFGWDIDFALDMRVGDSFAVVYEELYLDGEKLRDGPILAAEFINGRRTIRAVRYVDENGDASYYTPGGDSMRKAFIRTPVDFARISSSFSLGRRHPILNKIRAHRGVDYAAPAGTPIKAAGDGKVIFAGTKGGYGRTVILQHGSNRTTLYAHMRSFRRGIRNGARVKQGQVIGYVGSSGLATGPHLHYEFRLNGVHRNPVTVPLPRAHPVPKAQRAQFEQASAPLLSQLDMIVDASRMASSTQ